MSIPAKLTAVFDEGYYYHIVCKAIPGKQLFKTDDNRFFFLQRYHFYLNPFVDTYAYCLLDNHAHFLVRVKSAAGIEEILTGQPITERTITWQKFLDKKVALDELLERQFNSFLVSYTRAYNNFLQRKGHLFNRPFKRIAITDPVHLRQSTIYIHANPVKHKLVREFKNYKWSSYQSILSASYTNLKRTEVLDLFESKAQFIAVHKEQSSWHYQHELSKE